MDLPVDQILHGYKDGHRRLAGSIELDPLSSSKMLTLSDLLASGTRSPSLSYICGYPLKSANKYVFARTWMAPEMKRPGCVWTHSLILDYGLLPKLQSLELLSALHTRPTIETISRFDRQLSLKGLNAPRERHSDSPNMNVVSYAISSLYGKDSERNVAIPSFEPSLDEALLIRLWDQMWPRLKRTFFFCSLTSQALNDPDAEASACILTNTSLSQSKKTHPLSEDKELPGLECLIHDVISPDYAETGLRRFMGRYAVDINSPWTSAATMAVVHDLLTNARSDSDILKAALLIRNEFQAPREASLLKKAFLLNKIPLAGTKVSQPCRAMFFLGFRAFKDQVVSIDEETLKGHIKDEVQPDASEICGLLSLATTSKRSSLGFKVLSICLDIYTSEEIASLDLGVSTKSLTAKLRPELYGYSSFWGAPSAERIKLLRRAIRQKVTATTILSGISPDPSWDELLLVLRYSTEEAFAWILTQGDIEIIMRASTYFEEFQEAFASSLHDNIKLVRTEAIKVICAAIVSTSLESEFSWEFWHSLIKENKSLVGIRENIDLSTLICGAAFSAKTRAAHEMFAISFDTIFDLADKNRLPFRHQRSLQKYTSSSRASQSYFCDDFIAALVKRYMQSGQISSEIIYITKRRDSFEKIVKAILQLPQGRSLLKELRDSLSHGPHNLSFSPYEVIKAALKKKHNLFGDWPWDLWDD